MSPRRRIRIAGLHGLLLLACLWCLPASPAAAHPLDGLAKQWDRGSFDSAGESLQWHFEKHGKEVGALDVVKYSNQASSFLAQVGKDRWTSGAPVPGETSNVRRFTRADRYIDLLLTSSGTRLVISFGAR